MYFGAIFALELLRDHGESNASGFARSGMRGV
jgi:hypothetical protein